MAEDFKKRKGIKRDAWRPTTDSRRSSIAENVQKNRGGKRV